MKNILCFISIFLLLGTGQLYSQDSSDENKIELLKEINSLSIEIKNNNADSVKISLNNVLVAKVEQLFNITKINDPILDSIDGISKIKSSDEKVQIFTWGFASSTGRSMYYGLVRLNNGKVFKLTSRNSNCNQVYPDNIYYPEDWYGAIYYDIVKEKYKRQTYYLLLGWKAGDQNCKCKLIEPLVITDDGIVKFGSPIIVNENGIFNREVFKHKPDASFVLKYDQQYIKVQKRNKIKYKKVNMVVFDHLISIAPKNSPMFNEGKFKVPAGDSYDGFIFKEGKWRKVKNIEARNSPLKKK
ncbi:MAG: hypothetical protein WBH98_04485 [Bacteroidales bacterium]